MTQSPRDRLTRTSMSLAVLAVFSVLTFPVVLPYIFGAVSMILAILSRGGRDTFSRRGRNAIIVAFIALALNTALLVSTILYFIRLMHDPQLQEQFSRILFQMYGITFEDLLKQLGIQNGVL